jgi:hypothetical protein
VLALPKQDESSVAEQLTSLESGKRGHESPQ